MNIFMTGASGFLGQYVLRALVNDDRVQKIYCLVHKTEPALKDERIIKIKGNIEDLGAVRMEKRTKDQIDICIVLAGVTDNRHADVRSVWKVNYEGVVSAISFCKENRIHKICFISSVNVNLQKKCDYAKSKLLAEKAVKESGLQYLIIRPALIFGADCKAGLKVIMDFISKYRIVPVFGDGRKLEQPIWVGECASYISYYLMANNWNRTIELYGRDAMTYNQMCYLIAKAMRKKVKLLHIPVWICVCGLRVLKAAHIRFPVSIEQIYHIDSDLAGVMDHVYQETGMEGDFFENNLKKQAYFL